MTEQDLSRIMIPVQSYILAVFIAQDSQIGSRWHTLPQIEEILEALLEGLHISVRKLNLYLYTYSPTLKPKSP